MTRSDTLANEPPRHLRADRTIADVRLTAWQRWPMLVVLVTIFLVGGKAPVWHNPFDIDRAIWLSYAPIPLLVAACLAWGRRLSPVTWFLNTLEIVLTKFALTYCIAIPLWAVFGVAPHATVTPAAVPQDPRHDVQAPAPSPWPDDRRGTLQGNVQDAEGRPSEDALVFVAAGLDHLDFARPSETMDLAVSEATFENVLIVVRRWQPLVGHSIDGKLHTLFIEGEDGLSRNVPLLPSGEPSAVRVHDLSGMIDVRCTVHRRRARLLVLHHPYSTRTDAAGHFTLRDVPALPLTIAAVHAKQMAELDVNLTAQGTATTSLQLRAP